MSLSTPIAVSYIYVAAALLLALSLKKLTLNISSYTNYSPRGLS